MRLSAPVLTVALLGATATAAFAQSPASGHRLHTTDFESTLVDDQGVVVHVWPSAFRPGRAVYMEPDGVLVRAIETGVFGPGGGSGGGVQRQRFDGSVIWDFRYADDGDLTHHDIEPMPNGNVLMIAWERKRDDEALDAGRNPAFLPGLFFYPDHVIEVQQTGPDAGTIVWEWHVWDHLVQDFDPTKANFGVPSENPGRIDVNYPPAPTEEFNHCNGIDYDPVNDWIVITSQRQNEVWIVDHSTTTAEAAGSTGGNHGKGGDLLYRWGNPAAYGAGTVDDQTLFTPHSPRIVAPGLQGAGNLLLFNNRASPTSRVEELELPLDAQGEFVLERDGTYGPDAPVWTYGSTAIDSTIMSSCERLPNGNTLICATIQGRFVEVTSAGQIVWDTTSTTNGNQGPFNVTYVDRSLWASQPTLSVSSPTGDAVRFELVASSKYAGDDYFVLGSATGTMPGVPLGPNLELPLIFDVYTQITLQNANTPTFAQFAGSLDATGRATATLAVPPSLPATLVGVPLHHAYVVRGATGGGYQTVSNAQTIEFAP